MGAAAEYSASDGAGAADFIPSKQSHKSSVPDYDKKFSEESQKRMMPALRELAAASHGVPGLLPLNAGLPPSDVFPIQSIQLNLENGSQIVIQDKADVLAAQQYNLVIKGYPKLLTWVEEHLQMVHAPPMSGSRETVITSGSNQALDIVFRMFLESGDSLLIEEYTYPHVPESMLYPMGIKTVPIRMDDKGMIPEALRESLATLQAKGKPIPKLLYTIPVGQNPTGCTTSLERKEKIYAICHKYDIVIMEDDPYFYLQFETGKEPKGLKNLEPSYLSMDADSRVIRFDSFSKCFTPGLRLGWITAHSKVIDKFIYHFHGVAMGSPSMSQVLLGNLLQSMGHEGFENHLKTVQAKYTRRAEIITQAAEKYLQDLAEWAPISAGMFMWIRLKGIEDASIVLSDLQSAGVIVVPGLLAWHSFPVTDGIRCNCLRLSFVTAKEEDLEEAISRMASVLRRHSALPIKPLIDAPLTSPVSSPIKAPVA